MKRSLRNIGAATSLYCIVHTLFAHRKTKRVVANWVGEETYRGWYRVFYNMQALVTTLALVLYIFRQPDHEIWRAKGPVKWLLRGAQLLAVCYGVWGAREVGIQRFAGLTEVAAWLKRRAETNEDTEIQVREAQGPAVDEVGVLRTGGPFRHSRHPLNFVPLFIFWTMPRVTTNGLVFNALVSIYMIVGSWHEELRLKEAYGEQFEKYKRSGIPFFVPRWKAQNKADENEVEAADN